MNLEYIKSELDFCLYPKRSALELLVNTLEMHCKTSQDERNKDNLAIKQLINDTMEDLLSKILYSDYRQLFCNCNGETEGCSSLFCRCGMDYALVEKLTIVNEHYKTRFVELHNKLSNLWVNGVSFTEVKELIIEVIDNMKAERDDLLNVINEYISEVDECEDILIKKSDSIPPIASSYNVDEEPNETVNYATKTRFLVSLPKEMGITPSMVSIVDVIGCQDNPSIRFSLREMWSEESTNCLPYVLTKYRDERIKFDANISILDGNLNTKYTELYHDVVIKEFNRIGLEYGDDSIVTYDVWCEFSEVGYLSENHG